MSGNLGLNKGLFRPGTVSNSARRERGLPTTGQSGAMMAGLMAELQSEQAIESPAYKKFKRLYRRDPVAFAHDCIRWTEAEPGLVIYQDEILAALIEFMRVCVRSPHGAGKSMTAAVMILWFALTRDGEDWKCPTTATAWRQLDKFLWPEVHKWARRLRWDKIGRDPWVEHRELLDLDISLTTGAAFATASNDPARLEGAHADQLLYLIDEGKAVPASTWDAIEGAFAGAGDVYAGAWSTPGEPAGRFYDIQSRKPGYEDWHVIHITLEDCIRVGRIKRDWADQRRRSWGAESALYKNRVLGEFASSDLDGVIPLSFVEAANDRWREWKDAGAPLPPFTCLGVDVGGGGDKSTIAHRYDWLIERVDSRSTPDTMRLVAWVWALLCKLGGYASIDIIGIGMGTVHRLREKVRSLRHVVETGRWFDPEDGDREVQKSAAYGFNASVKSLLRDVSSEMGFFNMRAEGWWNLREMLDPNLGATLALPPDDELTGDLTSVHYQHMSGGKIKMQEKAEIRDLIGRSPDKGDAVMMACINVNSIRGSAQSIMEHYVNAHRAQQGAQQPGEPESERQGLMTMLPGRSKQKEEN